MSEDELLPEDFDLEEFQREVNYELIHSFEVDPFEGTPIDLPYGQKVLVTLGHGRPMSPPPPGPLKFPFLYEPVSLVVLAAIALLGFCLGGGNLLVPSLTRNVIGGLSILLIVRAGDLAWRKWRWKKQGKQSREKREQQRKEEEAKKRLALLQAEEVLAQDEIKAKLCAVLQDFSGSVFEMSKNIPTTLLTIYVAGQLSVPLTPLVAAAVIFMLTKLGISAYCSQYTKK